MRELMIKQMTKEQFKAYRHEQYAKNPEKYKAYQRKYYAEHKEEILAKAKIKWRKNHGKEKD